MTPATAPQPPAARPRVSYRGLFREPVYADGPYDQGCDEDDLEESSD
ncbi:hypothetical protein AB0454_22725 [Streptomyces sp. NPDC093509]